MSGRYPIQKLSEIFDKRASSQRYLLPNFQRDFVWDFEQQKGLLASFIAGLPIGSVLLISGNEKTFASRELGYATTAFPKAGACSYILDGQQRLSTLSVALSDPFVHENWESTWNSLYPRLRCRWYIDLEDILDESQTVSDIFGVRDLKFSSSVFARVEQEELKDFIGEYKLFKRDKTKYFHPGFKQDLIKSKKLEARQNAVADELAKKNQIPLWDIHRGEDGLHRSVLDRIASNRSSRLLAEEIDRRRTAESKLSKIEVDELKVAFDKAGYKWAADVANWMQNLYNNSEVPSILLSENELPRAVSVFEALNRGGTPLSVFDLVVAKSARDLKDNSLSQIILGHLAASVPISALGSGAKCLKEVGQKRNCKTFQWNSAEMFSSAKDGALTARTQNQFLNILSILVHTKGGSGKRRDATGIDVDTMKKEKILSLTSKEISEGVKVSVSSLNRAMAFMQFRCGVISFEDIPYQLMILPIAFVLSDEKQFKNVTTLRKLEYWFWVSIFGGRYREKQNEVCAQDLKVLHDWCVGKTKQNPYKETVENRLFNVQDYCDLAALVPEGDDKLEARSAIKFGVLCLILANEAVDFLGTGKLHAWSAAAREYTGASYEVHHVIPLKNSGSVHDSSREIRKDSGHLLNSPLNLTYIQGDTNKKISSLSPSDYTKRVQDTSLVSHYLPISFKQNDGESDKDYQRRILTERFELIRAGVIQKLHSLLE